MEFCEHRYAGTMIAEFTTKRNLARQLDGNVAYFEQLIKSWQEYRSGLNQN